MNGKTGTVSSKEMDVYEVVESDQRYVLRLVTNNPDMPYEHIMSVAEKSPATLAMLQYWCLRLNRAFVNGYFFSEGLSSSPDEVYYQRVDKCFKQWIGQ